MVTCERVTLDIDRWQHQAMETNITCHAVILKNKCFRKTKAKDQQKYLSYTCIPEAMCMYMIILYMCLKVENSSYKGTCL